MFIENLNKFFSCSLRLPGQARPVEIESQLKMKNTLVWLLNVMLLKTTKLLRNIVYALWSDSNIVIIST